MRTHRKTGKMEKQAANLRDFTVYRGALPLQHSSSTASCTPPHPTCVLCCQRLKTRFNDFHVACWRQLALNLCKMFSTVAVVIQYSPHLSLPPAHTTPSTETLFVVRSIKVKFRLQVQVSPCLVEGRRCYY